MSWEKMKLIDCCVSIADGDHQPPPKSETGIPFVTIANIVNNQFDFTNSMFVPNYYYEKLDNKRKAQKGDILYSVVGSFGIPVFIKDDKPFVFQRHIAILRPNGNVDARFLYYTMLSRDFYMKADAAAIGAAQRTVSLTALRNIEITVPPIETQRRIADILSAYDDLIENNQKQIKLLEEAAQRLYKEWFVDLRFPGHEHSTIVDGVPEGWEICTLNDVIEFDPKVRLEKDRVKQFVPMSALSTSSMVLDMKEISETTSNAGSKFQNGDTLLARITPCLENGKTAFVHGLESNEGAIGSTEYIVMRSKRLNPYMVYLLSRTNEFRQYAINSMSGSDGRQRVKAEQIKMLVHLLPPTGVIQRFEQIVSPMFETVFSLNKQIFAATQARDRLLPKLMSENYEFKEEMQ